MPFQITALPLSRFQHLFALDDADLARHNAIRQKVTAKPGFPCRVSLLDAEPGEEVILVNFVHQDAATPFRASHAVYVRSNARDAALRRGETPDLLRCRLLSLRAFDDKGMMIDADVVDGRDLEAAIARLFAAEAAAYLHVHAAKPGCYLARVDRA